MKKYRRPTYEIALRIIAFVLFTIAIPVIIFLIGNLLIGLLCILIFGLNDFTILIGFIVGICYGLIASIPCINLHFFLREKLFNYWP